MLKLIRRLTIYLFLISLTSCYLNKETINISDYCYLYRPFPDDISEDVIDYWRNVQMSIEYKNSKGGVKDPEEKLFELFVDNLGTNNEIYYEKKCDRLHSD